MPEEQGIDFGAVIQKSLEAAVSTVGEKYGGPIAGALTAHLIQVCSTVEMKINFQMQVKT